MEITPLGDSALIVRVREQFEDAPEKALDQVLRAFHQLERAAIPGVIELAPAYTSVGVFYDPSQVSSICSHGALSPCFEQRSVLPERGDYSPGASQNASESDRVLESLKQAIQAALSDNKRRKRQQVPARLVEIPVCYDEEFAIDLEDVARAAGIPASEVVNLHSGSEYRVSCVGFTPGFPFLSGMPKKLATPRRATPRKDIPVGSVGIGGAQTGIYPLRSPGGWNLIGRTPLRLFDPKGNPPSLLRAGDRVRIRAISRDEFDAIKHDESF
jgi:inhibitor of KinA